MLRAKVTMWGKDVGVIENGQDGASPKFQYFPEFVKEGIEISPLRMPLGRQVYRFPELVAKPGFQDTFMQLPGLLADALPEKFGNQLLSAYLSREGRDIDDLTPVERLMYLGKRGMGALEFEPEMGDFDVEEDMPIDVPELVDVARTVLAEHNGAETHLSDDKIKAIIAVGTSAGGAKAKAVIAWNRETNEVRSGQSATIPEGFEHWLIKFDAFENVEHAISSEMGAIEYGYYFMARDAGIAMMDSEVFQADGLSHFMTKRFDRLEGEKTHVQSFAAIAHADRNPPGQHGYESMFLTAKKLGLGQDSLNELYRRMVFNIMARNQDDHTKNHGFLMARNGEWLLAPAYDLCFSYKPGNTFIQSHQMSCNGKRDNFVMADLLAAARVADIKRPQPLIQQVEKAVRRWPEHANKAGVSEERAQAIYDTFRLDSKQSRHAVPGLK